VCDCTGFPVSFLRWLGGRRFGAAARVAAARAPGVALIVIAGAGGIVCLSAEGEPRLLVTWGSGLEGIEGEMN
jgi:hypothetical protein